MNKNKPPGFCIEQIDLLQSDVGLNNMELEPRYNLGITNFDRHHDEENDKLCIFVSFDLMDGIPEEKQLFSLKCTFSVLYSSIEGIDQNMNWNEFDNKLVIAHIIPYVREFISNTTNRMPVPMLMLPPINTGILIKEYKAKLTDNKEELLIKE